MDWKHKLCSRKFWTAIAAFVSMLMITMGESQDVATKVTSLIMAGAAVVAYIVGEGLVDAASLNQYKPDDEISEDSTEDIEKPAD